MNCDDDVNKGLCSNEGIEGFPTIKFYQAGGRGVDTYEVRVCVYVYMCICICVFICICMYVFICICVYIYMYVYMCTCMCTCICICKCIYMFRPSRCTRLAAAEWTLETEY